MNICAYGYYRVNINYKWCSRDEYDYELRQPILNNYKDKKSIQMNGRELIELISTYLKDKYIVDFVCEEDKIFISEFNPFTGETNDVKIVFKALKKTVFDKKGE